MRLRRRCPNCKKYLKINTWQTSNKIFYHLYCPHCNYNILLQEKKVKLTEEQLNKTVEDVLDILKKKL